MSDKELEGKWDQTKGKAKEEFGKLTNDKSKEAEGKTDQIKGKIEEGIGEAKRKIKNTFDDK
ncbi:CsbD-like protein [Nonlabens xylanidelens]|uniref:CsbD-like protein n=1 Tax=Nonlabens xylanidelens TaxID=191564 RepID=A0A2S6IMI3_9FLAO|nr:CsbD family protein [Nonlabens xylanidelens]PPK95447.1 CsbD-like protein [Nonlabens xylanidelens]PQJ22267.1 CsbD family protein [Nonlabens xylanidelens]